MAQELLKRDKKLMRILPKHSGRSSSGRVTVRHQGGRRKRYLRIIDWKRDKYDIAGKVMSIEYDPNRSAFIALIHYADGDKRYMLAPEGLAVGDSVISGKSVDIKTGNALPIASIPIGAIIHNIELRAGKGAQIVRSAGSSAALIAKEGEFAQIKLPSSEIRLVKIEGYATIGQVSNIARKEEIIGTAGRNIRRGIRPTVRGTAQNPRSHPHGGGEGRSGEGMNPKTPWGKSARGTRTRNKKKWSNKFILQRRKGKNK